MYQAGSKEWDENYAKMVEERKKSESEPYIVGTPEWASEFEKKYKETTDTRRPPRHGRDQWFLSLRQILRPDLKTMSLFSWIYGMANAIQQESSLLKLEEPESMCLKQNMSDGKRY